MDEFSDVGIADVPEASADIADESALADVVVDDIPEDVGTGEIADVPGDAMQAEDVIEDIPEDVPEDAPQEDLPSDVAAESIESELPPEATDLQGDDAPITEDDDIPEDVSASEVEDDAGDKLAEGLVGDLPGTSEALEAEEAQRAAEGAEGEEQADTPQDMLLAEDADDSGDVVNETPIEDDGEELQSEDIAEGSSEDGAIGVPNADVEDDSASVKNSDIKENIKSRLYSDDMNNPDLFSDQQAGEYTYNEGPYGKSAYGQLHLAEEDEIARDAKAQREAGGDSRRDDDDGGHYIGARFGGSEGPENLDPQNRNLNRSAYKQAENSWAEAIRNGDKVFVNMESYKPDNTDRPTAYMGYAIFESPDGTRRSEFYSFQNESKATMNEWADEFDGDMIDEYDDELD